MIIFAILYAAITILLAAVDAMRIRLIWGKQKNINHVISWLLAIVTAAILLYITGLYRVWQAYVSVIGIRWLIFDPALNLFRGKRIDYASKSTNSFVDWAETRMGLGFWKQRIAALITTVVSLV